MLTEQVSASKHDLTNNHNANWTTLTFVCGTNNSVRYLFTESDALYRETNFSAEENNFQLNTPVAVGKSVFAAQYFQSQYSRDVKAFCFQQKYLIFNTKFSLTRTGDDLFPVFVVRSRKTKHATNLVNFKPT